MKDKAYRTPASGKKKESKTPSPSELESESDLEPEIKQEIIASALPSIDTIFTQSHQIPVEHQTNVLPLHEMLAPLPPISQFLSQKREREFESPSSVRRLKRRLSPGSDLGLEEIDIKTTEPQSPGQHASLSPEPMPIAFLTTRTEVVQASPMDFHAPLLPQPVHSLLDLFRIFCPALDILYLAKRIYAQRDPTSPFLFFSRLVTTFKVGRH